jgi:hypothetical protein
LLQNSRALNLLAQYNDSDCSDYSDSDADENETNKQYRDAKSSSSSSSSESSEEEITVQQIKKRLEAPPSDHDDSDGDEGNGENAGRRKKREPVKVKGEMGLVSYLKNLFNLKIINFMLYRKIFLPFKIFRSKSKKRNVLNLAQSPQLSISLF